MLVRPRPGSAFGSVGQRSERKARGGLQHLLGCMAGVDEPDRPFEGAGDQLRGDLGVGVAAVGQRLPQRGAEPPVQLHDVVEGRGGSPAEAA
jgi:hypothetical protein